MRLSIKTQLVSILRAGGSILVCCLLVYPSTLQAQAPGSMSAPKEGMGSEERQNDYAGLTLEQAIAKALETVKALEDSERDPDELQDERSDFIEANAFVERVLELDPINVTAGYIKGRLEILAGRPRAALPMIQEYVNDPVGKNNWYAYKILGDLYLASFPKHAVSQYRQAIALSENEPGAIIGLARAHLKLNTPKKAIERAQEAIRLDKEDEASYRATLAEALLMDEKFEDAERAAETAVKMSEEKIGRDPSRKSLLVELETHYDLHLQCASDLANLYPERAEYVVQLARIWQDKADLARVVSYHQAVMMIEQSRTNPQLKLTSDLLYEQARLNRLVSRDDKALIVLRELLALDPNFAPAIDLLKIIESEGEAQKGSDVTASATGQQ